MIFNIAEVDFPERFQNCFPEIDGRLKSNSETYIISGMKALLNILQAYQYETDSLRNNIEIAVNTFFPTLEALIQSQIVQSSSEGVTIMHLAAKIFQASSRVFKFIN